PLTKLQTPLLSSPPVKNFQRPSLPSNQTRRRPIRGSSTPPRSNPKRTKQTKRRPMKSRHNHSATRAKPVGHSLRPPNQCRNRSSSVRRPHKTVAKSRKATLTTNRHTVLTSRTKLRDISSNNL